MDSNILYHARVEEEGKPDAGYVGLTANTFKVRYGNHKTSFKHSAKRQSSYYSINGGKADLINQLPACANPFLFMTEATSMY